METTYDDFYRVAHLSSGQTILNIHRSDACKVEVCPLHKPSDHVLRVFPLEYDAKSYHFYRNVFGVQVLDPDDYILNRDGKAILRNAASCLKCKQTIESTFRHDYQTCHCGNIMVDGGLSYLRHGQVVKSQYKDESKIIFLTDYEL